MPAVNTKSVLTVAPKFKIASTKTIRRETDLLKHRDESKCITMNCYEDSFNKMSMYGANDSEAQALKLIA
jgi:hypothetical protein